MYKNPVYIPTHNLVTSREMCKQLGINFKKFVKASQVVQWNIINKYYNTRKRNR